MMGGAGITRAQFDLFISHLLSDLSSIGEVKEDAINYTGAIYPSYLDELTSHIGGLRRFLLSGRPDVVNETYYVLYHLLNRITEIEFRERVLAEMGEIFVEFRERGIVGHPRYHELSHILTYLGLLNTETTQGIVEATPTEVPNIKPPSRRDEPTATPPKPVVFICHASEDKDDFVRPLAKRLKTMGIDVWFDEFSLKLGDSLTAKIDEGLARAAFGVVVVSKQFFAKKWPQREYAGLVQKSIVNDRNVILPIWHNITAAEIRRKSPPLADRVAADSKDGLEHVSRSIYEAVSGANHEAYVAESFLDFLRRFKEALSTGDIELVADITAIPFEYSDLETEIKDGKHLVTSGNRENFQEFIDIVDDARVPAILLEFQTSLDTLYKRLGEINCEYMCSVDVRGATATVEIEQTMCLYTDYYKMSFEIFDSRWLYTAFEHIMGT